MPKILISHGNVAFGKCRLPKNKEALDLTQRLHFQEYRLDWLLPLELSINPGRLGSFSLRRLLTLMYLVELGEIDLRH